MMHFQIDPYIIEDIENPNHPSEFIAQENYSALIVRLPYVTVEKLDVVSFAFVIAYDKVYRYERENSEFTLMGTYSDLAAFLDEKAEALIKEVQRYHYDIELLEESLYRERPSDIFMQEWLRYKKDVSLIHRVMFHTALSFELFITHYKRSKNFDALVFGDVAEHMARVRDLAKSAMEKLDNLYDFYRAKVDERMNKNVYYLTMISGIFLPLTLITGFFGMNTGGLPLSEDPNGTWKVIVFSLVLEILLLVPFVLQNTKRIKRFRLRR